MKTLSILRHAKSSWEHPHIDDIDRPLLEKGRVRTRKICMSMIEKALIPDCIISSPARRAMQTATIVIEELKLYLKPELNEKFYPGRVNDIINEIAKLNNDFKHVMVVGHNPVFTELVNHLSNNLAIDWLSTSGLVTIEFQIPEWQLILGTKGNCKHYIKPKEL